jgi:hypothetical protein
VKIGVTHSLSLSLHNICLAAAIKVRQSFTFGCYCDWNFEEACIWIVRRGLCVGTQTLSADESHVRHWYESSTLAPLLITS